MVFRRMSCDRKSKIYSISNRKLTTKVENLALLNPITAPCLRLEGNQEVLNDGLEPGLVALTEVLVNGGADLRPVVWGLARLGSGLCKVQSMRVST
jgi:hypothetical protein